MEDQLTNTEAYKAMIAYLENLYRLTKSDDLAGFLGSMQLMQDGSTMDPAAWDDWLHAIKVAKSTTA